MGKIAARNRKARHDYLIEDKLEVGIALVGTEVKSLREGRGSITEAYAGEKEGELFLFNAYIPEYQSGHRFGHETRRPRKLLLHRREIDRLGGLIRRTGITLVPLLIYFNDRGIAKVQLAVARGKKKHDKRAAEKEREWQRERARLMREKG
ncbi:MAG: SsrA-binding protein SmpB [Proteobacteria bacterium]|nr:SsrA-binding protein SmpB [Pseudomonadota bacterium]